MSAPTSSTKPRYSNRSVEMSKGQKRSNRELKKPKQVKQKVSAAAAASQAKQGVFSRGKKK